MTLPLVAVDQTLRDSVHRRLLAVPFDPREVGRDELRARLERLLRDEAPLCPPAEAKRVLDELVDDVGGLGPLERWLADPTVSEIMVNGPGRAYVERHGRLEPIDLDLGAEQIARLAERVVAPLGLRLDHASPLVDARLADGSRLHAVLPPLAPDGPCLTIRRFVAQDVALDAFSVDGRGREHIEAMVRAGWNLLVAGATSAGKTTLCNALARAIDARERIVTIEETAELSLPQPHVVRLEARPANAEGVGAVSVRDLVRTALRMRPDRLIVGEVRGGEALDMLQALNTGHDGSLSTVHANGPAAALARLETLAMFGGVALPLAAIRAQIAAAIDAIVHVARGRDGRREIVAVGEVDATGTRVRTLLARRDGRLAPAALPERPARRAGVDLAGRVATMTTLAFALFGSGASAWLARRARRYAVLDRMRLPTHRRLPAWLEPRLVRMLDDAAIDMPPLQVVQMWVLAALVAGMVGIALDMHLAVAAVLGVLFGGPVVLHALRHRRALAVTAAIPDALERVAAELRAGGTVATAIEWLATDPGPLAGDFARVQARVQLGAAIPDALLAWARERAAAGSRSVAGALAVAHAQGGRAADALDSLATSLRERLGVVAEAHALSAQARYSALVVGIGPLVYLGFSMVVDRRAISALLGTNLGRLCAVAALALEGAGAWWMRRILGRGGPE